MVAVTPIPAPRNPLSRPIIRRIMVVPRRKLQGRAARPQAGAGASAGTPRNASRPHLHRQLTRQPPLTYGGGECHARPRMAVGLREEHRKLVREWNRFADDYNSVVAPRNLGRPLAASDDQMAEVRKLRKGGASLRRIAAETSVRRS